MAENEVRKVSRGWIPEGLVNEGKESQCHLLGNEEALKNFKQETTSDLPLR